MERTDEQVGAAPTAAAAGGLDALEALVRLEAQVWDAADGALREAGRARMATLLALRAIGRAAGTGRVQELSAAIGITIGAASKLVDRLERDGLAARRPHPADRRSSLLSLTTEGARAVEAAEAVADAAAGVALAERADEARRCLERIAGLGGSPAPRGAAA